LHHEFCRPALAAPEGVRNKFTQELKQTILDAMHNANDEADRGTGAAARIIPVSMSGRIDHAVEVILHRVRSGRPRPTVPVANCERFRSTLSAPSRLVL
jgi:hypothetical protein